MKNFLSVFLLILLFSPIIAHAEESIDDFYYGDTGIPSDYQDFLLPTLDRGDGQELESFNWIEEGKVTSAKNQGMCGSCWAFASTGVIESKILIDNDEIQADDVDIAELHQMACDTTVSSCSLINFLHSLIFWKNNCNRGGNIHSLKFWFNSKPIEEKCAPYIPPYTLYDNNYKNIVATKCTDLKTCDDLPHPYSIEKFYTVDIDYTDHIKNSLYDDGPGFFRFKVYSDFVDFWKNSTGGEVYKQHYGTVNGGHAVLIVGWDDTKKAWLCKNSWGETEGPNGDGTFWISYSDHINNLRFGMANLKRTKPEDDPLKDDPGEEL